MKLNDVLEIEPLSKALQRTLKLAHENGQVNWQHGFDWRSSVITLKPATYYQLKTGHFAWIQT